MELAKNFTLEELIRSDTAKKLGISNEPNDYCKENLRTLCEKVLQPARDEYGKPIRISSGYRSERLNRAVGGVPNSFHLYGQAADIICDSAEEMACLARILVKQEKTDLVIIESAKGKMWIHVQWRQNPRHRTTYITK